MSGVQHTPNMWLAIQPGSMQSPMILLFQPRGIYCVPRWARSMSVRLVCLGILAWLTSHLGMGWNRPTVKAFDRQIDSCGSCGGTTFKALIGPSILMCGQSVSWAFSLSLACILQPVHLIWNTTEMR